MNSTKDIQSLSGIEFENLCFVLLQKMGFSVETTSVSGDGGIDLVAVNTQPLFKGKYIVQCKRYIGSVGVPIIRDLYGVVTAERANKGILITTGHFTVNAVTFAADKNIELIDGEQLQSLLYESGLDNQQTHKERYFLTDPNFDVKKYDFYKSMIAQNTCTEDLGSKFIFEFLFHYFENDAGNPSNQYLELIHNGLAEEYLRLFDWYASKYFKKGKNALAILPYYVRKYKGTAQLYNFDLFDYVQARYEILKRKKWLKLWTTIPSGRETYYELDQIPEEIQSDIRKAVMHKDWSKVKYSFDYAYCEILNLRAVCKYFNIAKGSNYIFRNLIRQNENTHITLKSIIMSQAPHYGSMLENTMILSPEIKVLNGKHTLHGIVYSDKDIIINADYTGEINLNPFFDRYSQQHKEKIAAEIEKINILFDVLEE